MLFAPGERRSGDDAKGEREGGGLRSVPTTRPDRLWTKNISALTEYL